MHKKGCFSYTATFTQDVDRLEDLHVFAALSEQQQRLDTKGAHFPLLLAK